MDREQFDDLARLLATAGTRRSLLGILTGVGLGGLLSQLGDESTEAKRKRHGRRRSHRPGKRKDNRKGMRKGKRKGGKGGGGFGSPGPCTANGGACQLNSDCCSENCFGQVCADPVSQCAEVACQDGATGCCPSGCCASPANQCNGVGECCVPNCDGRQCGPDGCGGAGTCGACASGETCNATTGQCSPPPTCTAQNCPDGCCSNGPGNPGTCETGDTFQQCGSGGAHCARCANNQTCEEHQCVACTDGCTCSGQSACLTPNAPNAYCNADESCYCAVTRAGEPICASGAIQVLGGCETDQDCVDAIAGAYCIGASNQLQSPCIFGQSFCASPCNP